MIESDGEQSLFIHGLYVPETYPVAVRRQLTHTLDDHLSAYDTWIPQMNKPRHESVVLPGIACSRRDMDTMVVALDAGAEAVEATPHMPIFTALEKIRTENPKIRIVIWYAGYAAEEAPQISNLPSFRLARQTPGIDLIYSDAPLTVAFNAKAGIRKNRKAREFRGILQALQRSAFDGQVVSPQLISDDTPLDIALGDMTIDRGMGQFIADGIKLSVTDKEATVLGALATYQGSWMPQELLMSKIYTADELKEGRDPRTIKVYVNRLRKHFAQMNLGDVQNIHGIGNFVRPSDFKKPSMAPR